MNVTKVDALVNEVLAREEVLSLLNDTLGKNGDTKNYLSIIKGALTTWDGEVHEGYIVCHTYKTPTPETVRDFMPVLEEHNDYYFMEVTLEEVNNPFKTSHLWNPTFHKLLPITDNYKRAPKFYEGDTKMLCEYIIGCACRDTWEFTEVPMTKNELEQAKKKDWLWYNHHTTKVLPLTYNDIYSYWSTPLTEEEQKHIANENRVNEASLIVRFSEGELPPAEDDAWYAILANVDSAGFGDYTLERKVLNILKNRGFSVRIDGERDSFGWVTRGIICDGKIMCMI